MARDFQREYAARQERAQAQGFTGYSQLRRLARGESPRVRSSSARHGATARSSDVPGGPDLDTTSARRRIHEAVIVYPSDVDDWEDEVFSSSRVADARYSPSRRQLIVSWTNSGANHPPYVYDDIPAAVWTGFRTTGSAGRFVNHTLNTFPYRPYGGG